MATKSFIGYCENNEIIGIYCHWDGYLSHNGNILYNHYKNINKIKELIDLGALSILDKKINPTSEHSFEKPQKEVCVAYHRDRKEDKEILIFKNSKEIKDYIKGVGIDYTYIFKDNEWYVVDCIDEDNFKLMKLSDMLYRLDNNIKTEIDTYTFNLIENNNE